MLNKLICFFVGHKKVYIHRKHFNRMHIGVDSFCDPPPNWDPSSTNFTYKCNRCAKIGNEIVWGFLELNEL